MMYLGAGRSRPEEARMAKLMIITVAGAAAAGGAGAAAALYDDADASLELKWDNGPQG
jgi:hypothetical protein